MVIFYKKWKKYNNIQLTKNKICLNNRKMKNHRPSPAQINKKQNGLEQSKKEKPSTFPRIKNSNGAQKKARFN